MTSYFELGYYWLSFLGGVHCLGLAFYLRYLYRSDNDNHHLLAGIIALLSLWFFTGMLTKNSISYPMPLIFPLFVPGFYLLMPLLYHYCRRSLCNQDISPLHYLTAPLMGIWIAIDQWIEPGLMSPSESGLLSLTDYTPIATTLTVLAFLQSFVYYLLIFQLLSKQWSRGARSRAESLQDIRFRWLLTLYLALLLNWVVRVIMMLVPIFFGDGASEVMLAVPRIMLLLSLYFLAFYGLNRITRAAYLRGRLTLSATIYQKSSTQLLTSEELNYLQELMQQPKKTASLMQNR